MIFSPLFYVPAILLLIVFVLFTALAMFLREYAFRETRYSSFIEKGRGEPLASVVQRSLGQLAIAARALERSGDAV